MGTVLIALFGMLLPAATLAMELWTGMCADAFFASMRPSIVRVLHNRINPKIDTVGG